MPWPDKALSPNSRGHWAQRAKAAKKYRQDCFYLARIAWVGVPSWDGPIHVHLAFLPPDNRIRDRDNLQASAKALLDGLADALGVNDSRFYVYSTLGLCRKGGAIIVALERALTSSPA